MNERAASAEGAALVTKVSAPSTATGTVTSWLVRSMVAGYQQSGFLSAEVIPPERPGTDDWKLVQRFRSVAHIGEWKDSQAGRRLLQELVADGNDLQIAQEEHENYGSQGSVATAIVTQVIPGMESEYREWECRIQSAQAKFPGYRGSYFQPPTGDYGQWMTLLRFDTPEALNGWFGSSERKRLLEEARPMVRSTQIHHVTNSFPGWFPIDERTGNGPPNWKTFFLVLLGLYPIVMLEMRFLMPMLSNLPSALASFIGNVLSVGATTWLTMPLFIGMFKPWLFPAADSTWRTEIKGVGVILLLLAVEIAGLWNLVVRH